MCGRGTRPPVFIGADVQLLLDLPPPPLALSDFIAGDNGLLLATLERLLAADFPEQALYVWGAPGSGKTHLLQAGVAEALAQGWIAGYVDCRRCVPDESLYEHRWLAVDHVDALDEDGQFELFALYNLFRDEGRVLMMAGAEPPAQLPLRADLRTRLGWGLVFELQPLQDRDKLQALQRHAQRRGFQLPDEVAHYLIRHWPRDMHALTEALDAIDRTSLTEQRTISLPLARKALALASGSN